MIKKVAAIIVSYNSENELKNCIDSVRLQNNKQTSTIPIVVDNNSKDKSVAVAKKCKAEVIANKSNLGFSKAVNLGIKRAYKLGYNYILILNPDAVLQNKSLVKLLTSYDKSTDIGAVGPSMLHNDKSNANQGYYLKAPSFWTVLFFSTHLRPWALNKPALVKRYEETLSDQSTNVDQIPGACLLTSKDRLDKIGQLDEDFAIWFEDVEWSYRARKHGFKLMFVPDAEVIHEGGVSFAKWEGLDKSVTFYVSMKTFFRKQKPLLMPFVILALCGNSFVSYLKSHDKNHLRFIKRLIKQKKGILPV